MKISLSNSIPGTGRHGERGMAVIVVVIILSILLIYIAGNLRTLDLLQRDLKQLEQRQISRFKITRVITNSVPHTNSHTLLPVLAPQIAR